MEYTWVHFYMYTKVETVLTEYTKEYTKGTEQTGNFNCQNMKSGNNDEWSVLGYS